jgi:hypothetical protein
MQHLNTSLTDSKAFLNAGAANTIKFRALG